MYKNKILINNLPKSKEGDYLITINKGYDEIIKTIFLLGGICSLDQFKRIYRKIKPSLSESYINKITPKVIKEMEELKLIGTNNINKYKLVFLKRFSQTIISGDYNKYKRTNISNLLKDKNLKINLMKVEYYLKNNEILSLNNLSDNLLMITNLLYKAKKNDYLLPYDMKLLSKIIRDKGIDNCLEEITNLSPNNLLRILWIDINDIYKSLRTQNQTVSTNPYYLKLFKKDNMLTLHYAPQIIIFDVYDINYYSNKINDLFHKYFRIVSNHTSEMQLSYRKNGTLGWEGFNHFAYVLKIIGYNELELLEKKKFIDSHIKNNTNAILLTNCEFEYINISKYFSHSSREDYTFKDIDNKIDELLSQKMDKLLLNN